MAESGIVNVSEGVDHVYAANEIQMCQEIIIEDQFESNPTYMEDVDISASVENKSSHHHKGPIPTTYICDKTARQKSFSKRLKTFKALAEALHRKCGATVTFSVRAESGRTTTGSYPSAAFRSVKVQVGESPLKLHRTTPRSPPPATHSPKKMEEKVLKPINNMPGKKSRQPPAVKRITNKCPVCSIIYRSKADQEMKKRHGLQHTWLGCDAGECQYWAHAVCAGQKIATRKSLATLCFFCPAHQ